MTILSLLFLIKLRESSIAKNVEYLKSYVTSNMFVFFQETHPSIGDEKKWEDEFSGKPFFSHGKTNSCTVLLANMEPKS